MNLKVNGEYLDFSDEIEVEKKVKLFEDISSTDGDVSFSFDIPITPKNLNILSYPLADVTSKTIYAGLDCEIVNFGQVIYKGLLRVENKPRTGVISASFFSGNSNWFALLEGTLQDLDFSEYDEDLNATNIVNSWANTEGMKYPVIDSGALENRGEPYFVREDFVPFLYIKTVFKKIFQSAGLKITGELVSDPVYNNLLITGNVIGQTAIEDRTSYIGKTSTQASVSVPTLLTFTDEADPYYDGDTGNWASSTYTADVAMVVDVDLSLIISNAVFSAVAYIYVNGASIFQAQKSPVGTETWVLSKKNIVLESGDTLQIFGDATIGSADFESGSTVKVTPNYVYRTFGNSILPNWSKQKLVSNILQAFNVISSFDEFSRTITFNLFEKIKDKQPIDISQFVQVDEVNYEKFVGNYAKRNILLYQEANIDEIETYNKKNLEYGSGIIAISNTFIEEESDMIELDFSAPFGYYNQAFQMHIERLNINKKKDIRSYTVTTVSDASGDADVTLPADHGIAIGDIVEVKDSTVPGYNGVYIVDFSDSNSIQCVGLDFIADADLTLVHQRIVRSGEDDVFILIDSGPRDDFMVPTFVIQDGITPVSVSDDPSCGFFDMQNNGLGINDFFKSGLSFGSINVQGNYQRTLIDNYWRLFTSVVNDPAMATVIGYLPLSVFKSIDFLSPVFIKTSETSNLWYVNMISGYKGQNTPCELELIKL